MSRKLIIVTMALLVGLGTVASVAIAFAPPLEPTHEYEAHAENLQDIVYDAEHDVVWSIDGNLEGEVTFVGYDVASEEVIERQSFEDGHALTVGPGAVYIASGSTLWTFNVSAGSFTESFTLPEHVAALEYDADRNWLWAGGNDLVFAVDATDGTETVRHEAHEHGIADIAVGNGYIASGATWEDEVIVYDIEAGEVAYEPELPGEDDGVGVGTLDITQDNRLIAGAGEHIPVFDLDDQSLVTEIEGHIFGTSEVLYAEEHDALISTGADNRVQVYDMAGETVTAEYGHDDTIYVAALDTHNELLWIGDGEGDNPGTVTGLDMVVSADDDSSDDGQPDDSGDDTGDDGQGDDGTADGGSSDDGSTGDSTTDGQGDDGTADGADDADDDTTDDQADDAGDTNGDTTDGDSEVGSTDDTADSGDDTADSSADDTDSDSTHGDDGLPGFGPVVALAAILVASGLVSRRRQG